MSEKRFPQGFFWGAATASYQVEGGIENCDWAEAAREGRVPECGNACEHYERYEADFDIARSLGHNCHRLSVEWARIEPEEGKFDEAAIAHYRDVLKALRARGMEPFVTLWHFTLPQWFADKGGFERHDAPEIFAQYCAYIVAKLGDECTHFSTMNEPMVFASAGWLRGMWPPFKRSRLMGLITLPADPSPGKFHIPGRSSLLAYWRVIRHLIRAHDAAYVAAKHARPDADIGIVKHIVLFHATSNIFHRASAAVMNWLWTHYFLSRVARRCDSIGVNYYQHKKFGDTRTYEKTDMGWDIYPEGICDALRMVKRYGKPVYISEAGIADEADKHRAAYITRLIACMHAAIEDGVDVRGFMYWSLLDNYEWAMGFAKRFGLVAVDFATQERTARPSAYVYKGIIERNALVE